MPLPEGGNTAWPPKPLEPVYERIASWDAWYSGDPERLSGVYGGTQDQTEFFNRPAQYAGGIAGAIARWFWGAPTAQGEKRSKLHIPLAGDIAAKSSKLLFAEPPEFTMPDANGDERSGSTRTQDRLNELVDDSIHATLLESGEICAGLGGVYLRVVWDASLVDKPWISAVHADAAVPEWRWGRLSAVTFWRVLTEDSNMVIRHLERHEPGSILHGVYQGTRDELGHQVPLTEHPDTAALIDGLVEGNRIDTGVPNRLTAVYVPNMRPNRVWRNLPAAAHLGRSDLSGIEPALDALDETWTSLMRDIRLGKGRAFVPSVYLQSGGPGKGASFDGEREIYETLNMLPSVDKGTQLTVSQFEIRVDEHLKTAQELIASIVRGAGYSAQSFGMTGEMAVTATEVTARERDSFLTRAHKILYWRTALAEIVETLLAVDGVKFGSGVTPQRPEIEWPDGVAEDPEAVARTLQLLEAAAAASTQTKVEMLHPDWDEPRVKEEVDRITDETGRGMLEDPGSFRGAAGPINARGPQGQQQEDEPAEQE